MKFSITILIIIEFTTRIFFLLHFSISFFLITFNIMFSNYIALFFFFYDISKFFCLIKFHFFFFLMGLPFLIFNKIIYGIFILILMKLPFKWLPLTPKFMGFLLEKSQIMQAMRFQIL